MLDKKFFQSQGHYDNYVRGLAVYMEAAKQDHAGNVVLIDDAVPVPEPLRKFFMELRHKRPGLMITLAAGEYVQRRMHESGFYFYSGVGLAFEQAPDIVIGGIFLDREESGARYVDSYGVNSPTIVNERYASHNRKHHMKKSKDFKKAMKVAAQHIKPRGYDQLRSEYEHAIVQGISAHIRQPALETLREKLGFSHTEMFDEVRNMIRSGYVPLTGKMQVAKAIVEEQGDELERTRKYNPRKAFVWLNTDRAFYRFDDEKVQHVANTIDELPEDMRTKLAVLQIGPEDSTIIDVGMKIDDTKFWVFV